MQLAILSSLAGLLQLIDDIQSSIERGKKLIENTEVTNPVKVTYAIKQLAKEAAVGEGEGGRESFFFWGGGGCGGGTLIT
jgi:hypothetical protein